MEEKVVVIFNLTKTGVTADLEVPTDITVVEFLKGLKEVYNLDIDVTDIKQSYLKMENPIALMRGNHLLSEYGIRNGSIINFNE